MAKLQKNFAVDPGWQVLFKDLGISSQDLLRQARLPLDLFSRNTAYLTAEEYYLLFEKVGECLGDPAFPLHLGQSVSVEAFSPTAFACFCSSNLNVALSRLSQFKPLICPFRLELTIGKQRTVATLCTVPEVTNPPCSVIACELVFFVHLARLALRETITPEAVYISQPLPEKEQYETYFGTSVTVSNENTVVFAAADAEKPFLTANHAMWSIFEPRLKKLVDDLSIAASFEERVRSCLFECLASGECTIADISRKLGVSTRTLQRRLQEEGTNFQALLNSLREELAVHYLTKSQYSNTEIAFLLGYDDPNSFFRAFQSWTGKTPENIRNEVAYTR